MFSYSLQLVSRPSFSDENNFFLKVLYFCITRFSIEQKPLLGHSLLGVKPYSQFMVRRDLPDPAEEQ